MMKIIIWRTIELITFAIGTFIFVTNVLHKSIFVFDRSPAGAGIGAFMIVFGLLLKNWRNNFFIDNSNKSKDLIFGLIMITVFTLWGLNYRNINSIERDIESIEDKVSDLDSMENRIDYLEYDSHSH